MSTKIIPYNFNELLQAEIAYLQGESFELLPDFLSSGICDASGYMSVNGKVRAREKLEFRDQKTIIVRELPYGVTNESLINSIEEASKRAQKSLQNLTEYTIAFLKGLLEKYGKEHIRRTIISQLGEIDKKEIGRKEIEVNYDLQSGYIGLKVSSSTKINCTNFDKLLIFYDDGVYKGSHPANDLSSNSLFSIKSTPI
ncbi:hypothetical protein ACTFIR_005684 [Dictyostelium discoideum]